MNKNFKSKKIKQAVRNRLENILANATDIYKTITVINAYCKFRSDSEGLYNISFMMKTLEEKADDVARELSLLLSNDESVVSDFLLKIVPLKDADVIIDD